MDHENLPVYEYGLRNCGALPQEYKLSHILAGYQQGFRKTGLFMMPVGVPRADIADGSWDFLVPSLQELANPEPTLLQRLRLALKVFRGEAGVLYYE